MIKNIGKIEKIIRMILCGLIIAQGIYFKSWLGAIGLAPLLTGTIGWCPLHSPFGISIIRKKKVIN